MRAHPTCPNGCTATSTVPTAYVLLHAAAFEATVSTLELLEVVALTMVDTAAAGGPAGRPRAGGRQAAYHPTVTKIVIEYG